MKKRRLAALKNKCHSRPTTEAGEKFCLLKLNMTTVSHKIVQPRVISGREIRFDIPPRTDLNNSFFQIQPIPVNPNERNKPSRITRNMTCVFTHPSIGGDSGNSYQMYV